MSDTAAPAVSAPSAPATPQAPAAAPAAQAASTTAANAPAAKTGQHAATAQPAASAGKPATPPASAAPAQAPGAEAAKQESQPVDPAKPTAPEKDEVAETMARLNREQREIASAKKKLATSQQEMGDKVKLGEVLVSAREALGKKDFLGALTALAGEAGLDPDEAAVLLLEQASGREKPALTEEQARKVAEKAFEDKQKAAQEEAAKQEEQQIAEGKQAYGGACAEIYKADPSKFPLIAEYGLSDTEIFEWVIPEMKRNRNSPPSPLQTMEHFEKRHFARFEKAAKALGYVKATPQPAPAPALTNGKQAAAAPAPSIVPAADTAGSVTENKRPRETIAEYNRRVREQFRARRQASQ